MSTVKVLVTGGAGFIGSHLVDALVEQGHDVRILDSLVPQVHGDSIPSHLNSDAEFLREDICDQDAVAKALDGIDVVFHQAAEVGVGQSMYEIVRYVRANDLGTAVLLEEIVKRRDRIKKVIVASSMSIYGEGAYRNTQTDELVFPQIRSDEQLARHEWELSDNDVPLTPEMTPEEKTLFPTSVYAVTKQDQEQYCLAVGRAYKIPTVALRYFNVYGTRQALSNPYTGVCAIFSARLMNNERPIIFEDGGQSRDFVHVSDIVRANLMALASDSADYQPINVGSGRAVSVGEISAMLAQRLGKSIEGDLVGKYREGDIRHCVADISRARRLLGYEPTIRLEDGLDELIGWVSTQRPSDRVGKATSELAERSLVK